MTLTEVVKTKFLSSTSTRDRLLAPEIIWSLLLNSPFFLIETCIRPLNKINYLIRVVNLFLIAQFFIKTSFHKISPLKFNLPKTNLFKVDHPLTARNQPFNNIYHHNSAKNQSISSITTMSSGVNCPFIETDSIQNVCQQNLKKKKPKWQRNYWSSSKTKP